MRLAPPVSLALALAAALAPAAVADELEARVALSRQGFFALRGRFPGDSETRRDEYLELWAGGDYLLGTSPERYKLRLRTRDRPGKKPKSRLMFSWRLDRGEAPGPGPVTVARTDRARDKLDADAAAALAAAFREALGEVGGLARLELAALPTVDRLAREAIAACPDVAEALAPVAAGRAVVVVPADRNQKIRWELSWKDARGRELWAVLGLTMDQDEDGIPRVRYELEVEPDEAEDWTPAELAAETRRHLELDALPPGAFAEEAPSRREWTRAQLKKLKISALPARPLAAP